MASYLIQSGGFLQENKAPEVKLFWAERGQTRQSPFADAFLGRGGRGKGSGGMAFESKTVTWQHGQILKDGTYMEISRCTWWVPT